MTPHQLIEYQNALYLLDQEIGFIFGLRIDESRKIIPAMKSGEHPIEDWMQQELMHWLGLLQNDAYFGTEMMSASAAK